MPPKPVLRWQSLLRLRKWRGDKSISGLGLASSPSSSPTDFQKRPRFAYVWCSVLLDLPGTAVAVVVVVMGIGRTLACLCARLPGGPRLCFDGQAQLLLQSPLLFVTLGIRRSIFRSIGDRFRPRKG